MTNCNYRRKSNGKQSAPFTTATKSSRYGYIQQLPSNISYKTTQDSRHPPSRAVFSPSVTAEVVSVPYNVSQCRNSQVPPQSVVSTQTLRGVEGLFMSQLARSVRVVVGGVCSFAKPLPL